MNRKSQLFILAMLSGASLQAQQVSTMPRLVVGITIEHLRQDYIERYAPLFGEDGFNQLLSQGLVYDHATYSFTPVNNESAITAIVTGATPRYNGIVDNQWLDRKTLRPVSSIDDEKTVYSPSKIATSTVGDELKIATDGKAIVYSVAAQDADAIMAGGHAADGAFWWNSLRNQWATSAYYPSASYKWITAYNKIQATSTAPQVSANESVCKLAVECAENHLMGNDDITDLLMVTLNADPPSGSQTTTAEIYKQLDSQIASLISGLGKLSGKGRVLFVLAGTGPAEDPNEQYRRYRVPTGKIDIGRTVSLLNMYLSAIYGQGKYIEANFGNELYLNHNLLEQKSLNIEDVFAHCRELLLQTQGINEAYYINDISEPRMREAHNKSVCGDIILETNPGWEITSDNKFSQYKSQQWANEVPLMILGLNATPTRITTPVNIEQIAPAIANTIHIRAPNGCRHHSLPTHE